MLENLSDVGEANINVARGDDLPGIDLVLTAAIVSTKELQKRRDRYEVIYEVDVDFSCEEVATRTVKFAEKAKGRTIRTQFFDISGKPLGGFQEGGGEKQAIYSAAMKSLVVMANKLGNTYPVGGEVTGLLGDRMTLNRGFEHGIGKDNQMVVYAKVSGVDVPVGIAQASPGSVNSNLLIHRWNRKDKYAKRIIAAMNDDLGWLDSNRLFAVSAGMSVPPEWESAYGE